MLVLPRLCRGSFGWVGVQLNTIVRLTKNINGVQRVKVLVTHLHLEK